MNPDTPDDVEIGCSSSRMLPLVVLAATMTLRSASIGFDWFGFSGIGRSHALVGCAGLAVFAVATSRPGWLLSVAKRPVLLIGRYGIRDLRVANEFIPRDSITNVSTCEYRRRKFVALKITPALERQRFATRSRGAVLNANTVMGVDGVAISSSGLTADFDTLLDFCTACHAAAKQAGSARVEMGGAASQWIEQCA
jgi:hypothetical protein